MTVRRLRNPVMGYAWGSHDGIATLQGRAPSPTPEAELWMGAHPAAPSVLEPVDGAPAEPLDAVIAADPVGQLGEPVAVRFGARLPFLLKVISAARPLSLQVHPDADQARVGFEREEAAGLDRAARDRCFRDPYAKPEMLVALSDFEALHGFRPEPEAADALAALGVAALDPLVAALRAATSTGEVFVRLVSWPDADRRALVSAARAATAAGAASDDPRTQWLHRLAADYPHDPGVIGILLLNYLKLQPGEALPVETGQIHAYLRGTAVEIMGSSDNVIRGGLTAKHVAVEQLVQLMRTGAAASSPLLPEPIGDAEERWPTARPEFALSRLRLDGGSPRRLDRHGPEIVLCLEGKVELGCADSDVTVSLVAGDAAFVPAACGLLAASGPGIVVRATPGTTG